MKSRKLQHIFSLAPILGALFFSLGLPVSTSAVAATNSTSKAQVPAQPVRSDVVLNNGRRLSFLTFGASNKPVLILMHGKGGTAAESIQFAEELARDYRVYALDFRGSGLSDWAPDGDYTVESTVDDLTQFVSAMQLDRFVLYGHSYGAVVGIAYAASNAGHTALLILEDGGPTTLSDGTLPPANPGQTYFAGTPTPAPQPKVYGSWNEMAANETMRSAAQHTHAVLESRFVRHADGTVHARNDVLGLWKTVRGAGFTHPWPLVRALTMPTLLLRAERGLVPAPIAQEMVRTNPQISSVTINGAGHGIHYEMQDRVISEVQKFTSQHTAQIKPAP